LEVSVILELYKTLFSGIFWDNVLIKKLTLILVKVCSLNKVLI
jgi:hypothetical protein